MIRVMTVKCRKRSIATGNWYEGLLWKLAEIAYLCNNTENLFVMTARYVNPFTDFGFKKLFGTEVNKDLLIDFLNSLIHDQGRITDLTYLKSERLGESESMRKAIFDVYCENERGEKFIVEMQKAPQAFFKDRSIFYSTFPIRDQAIQGKEWNFELKAVYTIGILNFVFDDNRKDDRVMHHEVKLLDVNSKEVFYDKLTYIYLEMPKFRKTEAELETNFDKWLYLLKHLPDLERRPGALQDRIFERAFQIAEIARFTPQEREEYEEAWKTYNDWNNIVSTAKYEGRIEGKIEGRIEGKIEGEKEGQQKALEQVVRSAIKQGLANELIASLTGLTLSEIEKYR